MNREELEALLADLEKHGLNIIAVETLDSDDKSEDYDDYLSDLKMKKKFSLSKLDFNRACDYVVERMGDISFTEVLLLAKFTSAVRYVLFDMDNETEEEEN